MIDWIEILSISHSQCQLETTYRYGTIIRVRVYRAGRGSSSFSSHSLSFLALIALVFLLSLSFPSRPFTYFSFFSSGVVSAGFVSHQEINLLLDRCFLDLSNCKEALVRIHSYQVKAGSDKEFPCQTRLLGLEANLLMAMNNNLKKKKIYNYHLKNKLF